MCDDSEPVSKATKTLEEPDRFRGVANTLVTPEVGLLWWSHGGRQCGIESGTSASQLTPVRTCRAAVSPNHQIRQQQRGGMAFFGPPTHPDRPRYRRPGDDAAVDRHEARHR